MKYYKAIVFCSNLVQGHFRFKDVFQIYPFASEKAPRYDKMKFHPFILEYCLQENEQISFDGELHEVSGVISEMTSSSNFQNQILNLLTAFSNYRFYYPGVQLSWFASVDSKLTEDEINEQTSQPGLNYFTYTGMKEELRISKFSKVDAPEIEPKEHRDYFRYLDLDDNKPVEFSQYIHAAFHNYFLLENEQRAVVDSAVMLINQGIALRERMKSLSFIALVSSIETMASYEFRNDEVTKCSTCGQEQFKVMAKFRDYLFKYASDNPDNKKEVNAIYTLRSKIVHSGMLLLGDGKIHWSNKEKSDSEWQIHIQIMQISRVSLINWILMRGEESRRAAVSSIF